MAAYSSKESLSTVGQIIREYRKARGITQKQFAGALGVEARTLRMYENGERALENISDLRRIAELLEIDPAELGLAASLASAYTAEQVQETLEQIISLVLNARLVEARTTSEALLRDLTKQSSDEDPRVLARAHCVAGLVQSITRKTRELAAVVYHYQEMAKIAQTLGDATLLSLALSYHGDMLRRRGDIAQALAYLEKARESAPLADCAASGTNALLLGQAFLTLKDYGSFATEMARAEELARSVATEPAQTQTLFNLGLVYEGYARGYALMGDLQRSQYYLQLAEQHLPACNLWSMSLKAVHAEALIRAGEITNAMPFLIEVAHLAQMYGHQRLIERLYRLQYYLDDQVSLLRQASRSLSEVLHGPIEY